MSVTTVQGTGLEHLLAQLRRITALVSERLSLLQSSDTGDEDEFRGLYVSEGEVQALLADPELFRAEGSKSLEALSSDLTGDAFSRLARLQKAFGLSPFELDVVLIALAPELDLRYEKIYAFLQDDVTRRRPSVDLALRLLCPGLAAQIAARRSFDADAPLLNYRLIELSEEAGSRQTAFLSRSLKLDDGIVAYLLGEDRPDARLRHLLDFTPGTTTVLAADAYAAAGRLVELAADGWLCVLLGPDEAGKRSLATTVCREAGVGLVVLDVALLPGQPRLESLGRLIERESLLHGTALYLAGCESLLREREEPGLVEARRVVSRLLQAESGLAFVSSNQPELPGGMVGPSRRASYTLRLELPGYLERQAMWEALLGPVAVGLDLESLSSRFRLAGGQIEAAVATARAEAIWRGEPTPTLADLESACRTHSSGRLNGLARKIVPRYTWDDLVLPTDQFNILLEIYEQVRQRTLVYDRWGFDRKVALGKGLNVVFAGPSGTGKTMSAEVLAGELGMDLYKIDLSNMVSKYIGETEKNLERIFTEAGESNAILFFDEADSIFGKRSEVRDAHDRYANIETGYLLQKMEEYDGIVVLATNLRKNLDDAFVRRMHFMLEYPFPEEEDRLEIWRKVFPVEVPLGQSVDLRFMARQFKIAGGNIKNIALAAAFLAAGDLDQPGQSVEMAHLIGATRREFQKMGKLCTHSDFGPYFALLNETKPRRKV